MYTICDRIETLKVGSETLQSRFYLQLCDIIPGPFTRTFRGCSEF